MAFKYLYMLYGHR